MVVNLNTEELRIVSLLKYKLNTTNLTLAIKKHLQNKQNINSIYNIKTEIVRLNQRTTKPIRVEQFHPFVKTVPKRINGVLHQLETHTIKEMVRLNKKYKKYTVGAYEAMVDFIVANQSKITLSNSYQGNEITTIDIDHTLSSKEEGIFYQLGVEIQFISSLNENLKYNTSENITGVTLNMNRNKVLVEIKKVPYLLSDLVAVSFKTLNNTFSLNEKPIYYRLLSTHQVKGKSHYLHLSLQCDSTLNTDYNKTFFLPWFYRRFKKYQSCKNINILSVANKTKQMIIEQFILSRQEELRLYLPQDIYADKYVLLNYRGVHHFNRYKNKNKNKNNALPLLISRTILSQHIKQGDYYLVVVCVDNYWVSLVLKNGVHQLFNQLLRMKNAQLFKFTKKEINSLIFSDDSLFYSLLQEGNLNRNNSKNPLSNLTDEVILQPLNKELLTSYLKKHIQDVNVIDEKIVLPKVYFNEISNYHLIEISQFNKRRVKRFWGGRQGVLNFKHKIQGKNDLLAIVFRKHCAKHQCNVSFTLSTIDMRTVVTEVVIPKIKNIGELNYYIHLNKEAIFRHKNIQKYLDKTISKITIKTPFEYALLYIVGKKENGLFVFCDVLIDQVPAHSENMVYYTFQLAITKKTRPFTMYYNKGFDCVSIYNHPKKDSLMELIHQVKAIGTLTFLM